MLVQSIKFRRPGLAASLGLHAAMLVCIVFLVRPPVLPKIVQQAISVELVAPLRTADYAQPSMPSAIPGSVTPETADLAQEPQAPAMIHATKMLASTAFADPRNKEAREMLGHLDAATRREQLCGVEAIEQIEANRPEWHPESVVAYAFADTQLQGNVLTADGAAVLIAAQWRKFRFICTLAPDLASVTAFDFLVGAVVSEEERKAHDLASDDPD